MHGSRRPDENSRLPYQKRKPKIKGVRKFRELVYEGWRIILFQRDMGVQARRIAYSARVNQIGSRESFYVPPADSETLVIKSAQCQINLRQEQKRKAKNYDTIDRVLNLWFRDDELEVGDSCPPVLNSLPLPENLPAFPNTAPPFPDTPNPSVQ